MNLKKIEKEIKKTLDNLDKVRMSNTLKAEAIVLAINPIIEEENQIPVNTQKYYRTSKNDSN